MRSSKLSEELRAQLRCPVCRGTLESEDGRLVCRAPACRTSFPVVEGIPVLINDRNSVFSMDDFVGRRDTTFHLQPGRLERLVHGVMDRLPAIGESVGSASNYARYAQCLLDVAPAPRVLVIGGSILGQGMEALTTNPAIQFVATDVSFGPFTSLICDAHDIPFADETFDGVIVQAVLEHVVDPRRCVEEIRRVLKNRGVVYAETPFMQQVHMGRYDFTRFTHSGHRRLFRDFDEIASGPVCGPGMALAWSYQYFFLSFTTSKALRAVVRAFTALTSFYLKYFDYYLIHKPAAFDAASGYYFIGQKEGRTLSDRQLVAYYKGAIS
jgi:SAM-dependent methyltransferase/uncharacterized protein YbaR (Trm112 family)